MILKAHDRKKGKEGKEKRETAMKILKVGVVNSLKILYGLYENYGMLLTNYLLFSLRCVLTDTDRS